MRHLAGILLVSAVVGATGSWRAFGDPVLATNHVALTWSSLGSGTRYSVQTSTNLLNWSEATNTLATNVCLAFTADKSRVFRLLASNAPPVCATLMWDSPYSADVAGYTIYYGVSPRTYTNQVQVGPGTTCVLSNLAAGTVYYFAATSRTSTGVESDFSDEIAWRSGPALRLKPLP